MAPFRCDAARHRDPPAAERREERSLSRHLSLEGDYREGAEGIWDAAIRFQSDEPPQILETNFIFVRAGSGVLWLASQGTLERLGRKRRKVAEMAQGEAQWIGPVAKAKPAGAKPRGKSKPVVSSDA